MTNKVRVNSTYYYVPTLLDRYDGRTGLHVGDQVKVINVHGCPPANTMGHCYVGEPDSGKFIGIVCCNSLHTRAEYRAYLIMSIARKKAA
jgi:hypothetical protein